MARGTLQQNSFDSFFPAFSRCNKNTIVFIVRKYISRVLGHSKYVKKADLHQIRIAFFEPSTSVIVYVSSAKSGNSCSLYSIGIG